MPHWLTIADYDFLSFGSFFSSLQYQSSCGADVPCHKFDIENKMPSIAKYRSTYLKI